MPNDPAGLIIAVDFDGTCVTHDFPKIGKPIGAVPVLHRLVDAGHRLILFTMRDGEHLKDAVEWFMLYRIHLWGVNVNPEQNEWTGSPKAYANLYIDDAALGAPLKFDPSLSHRPFIDWEKAEDMIFNEPQRQIEKIILPKGKGQMDIFGEMIDGRHWLYSSKSEIDSGPNKPTTFKTSGYCSLTNTGAEIGGNLHEYHDKLNQGVNTAAISTDKFLCPICNFDDYAKHREPRFDQIPPMGTYCPFCNNTENIEWNDTIKQFIGEFKMETLARCPKCSKFFIITMGVVGIKAVEE